MYRVIRLHTSAPDKPPAGEPCNGCGVCCASEPCPIGILVSRRRHGACAALEWSDDAGLYRCGLIENPAAHLPVALRRAAPLLAPAIARLARRYIAADLGCDCDAAISNS